MGPPFPAKPEIFDPAPGLQKKALKGQGLRMTSPAPLFVIRAQDLAGLWVHQMRLSARKARHLDVSEVIVFGSGPSLDVVACVGQR